MASKRELKTRYEEDKVIESVYTGGKMVVRGDTMYTLHFDGIYELEFGTAKKKGEYKGEGTAVTTFAVSHDKKRVVAANKSLRVRVFDGESKEEVRVIKNIETAIIEMEIEDSGTLVGMGLADGTVRVYDIEGGFCTHKFGGHRGIVTSLLFYTIKDKSVIISGGEEGTIKVFDLNNNKCEVTYKEVHGSVVKRLGMTANRKKLISGGRDKMINVIDMASKKVERTEVVYERVEAMEVVGNKTVYYGGEGGRMKVFKIEKGVSEDVEMEDANDSGNKDEEIVWIAKSEDTNTIIQADSEQNIMGFSCDNLNKKKWQIAGYNDEVIESRYIESGNKIAVISNSDKLKIYNTETLECEEMVRGAHDDIILSMDVYGTYIATGSKDRTIKLWEYKDNKISLLAKGVGHMGAVGAIKIVPLKDGGVELVSGSMDSSIKRWKYGNGTLVGEYTIIKVHEKGDVNTLNVNTDQGIIVSGGSQDKVGRILNYRDGSVVGELKGHKRGIWAIEFYGHIVATSSGDSTIKLWSLNSNYDCIQTIDCGSTVLSMKIISNGMQILGGCNDALVRLFNISSSQVVAMFGGENSGPNKGHSDKIWSLDTFNDSSLMVTGSSDSKIIIWNDQSQVLLDQYIQKQQEDLLTSQKLDNLLSNNGDLILAFKLALSLNKPHTCLSILSKHTNRSTSATSSDAYEFYDVLIKSLSPEEVSNLLNLVLVDWSTNLKLAAFYSQILLFSIFKHHRSVLMDNHQSIKSLIPHTNKFLKFWNSLLSDSAMLDFYLQFS